MSASPRPERYSVPVAYADRRLVVDPEDFAAISRRRWEWNGRYVTTRSTRGGRKRHETIGVYLLRPAKGVRVYYANGDPFDARRANLVPKIGSVRHDPRCRRRPWLAFLGVDGVVFSLGPWPTEAWAWEACRLAGEVAPSLRGRGLSRAAIQAALDRAVGRRVDVPTKGARIDVG